MLTYKKQANVELYKAVPTKLPPFDLSAELLERLDVIVGVFHLFKPCDVQVVRETAKYVPTVLPLMDISRTGTPHYVKRSIRVEFDDSEFVEFASLYQRVLAVSRREIFLAISRLRDAQLRLNPTDSIIDAFIGIEAILNPLGAREISFTVALAYALLGPPDERSQRFTELSKLYGVRSNIVHGSVSHGVMASAKFASEANTAKACLRDLVHRVLRQDVFANGRKLDKKFWAEKLLESVPPNK